MFAIEPGSEGEVTEFLMKGVQGFRNKERLGNILKEALEGFFGQESHGIQLTRSPCSSPGNYDGQYNGYRIELGDLEEVLIRVAKRIAIQYNLCFFAGSVEDSAIGICSENPASFHIILVENGTEENGLEEKAKAAIQNLFEANEWFESARKRREEMIDKTVNFLLED